MVKKRKQKKSAVPKKQKSAVPKKQISNVPKEQRIDVPREQRIDVPREQRIDVPEEQISDVPKEQKSDVPNGYTPEQWAEYQADPVGFCIKELSNQDQSVRFNAVDILRGCAGDAKAAIPALCDLLVTEKVTTVRAQCAWALQEICERVEPESAGQAVTPLAGALGDPDAEVRTLAANALGAIGKPAESAKPELTKALNDSSPDVRGAAEAALKWIDQQ